MDSYDSESRRIFCSFRDLQDSHTSAPLKLQKFSKKRFTIFVVMNNFSVQISSTRELVVCGQFLVYSKSGKSTVLRLSNYNWNSSRARPPWVLFSTQKWLARMEAVNKMVSLHYLFSVNSKIRTGEQVQFYSSRWPLQNTLRVPPPGWLATPV